jgi:phage N-6-adenine-methyltransferase
MSGLIRYDAMRTAIAAAHAVDEAKNIRDKAFALEIYARQAKNTEDETWVRDIRIRASRRAGELLAEREMAKGARGNPGGRGAPVVSSSGTSAQTLGELGISHDQSSKWQKLAEVPEEEFEALLADPENPPSESGIITAHNHRAQGTGEIEWYTPAEYVAAARAVMGGIDLDPASSEIANRNVGAAVYFDADKDGLAQQWGGRVWMNPPYAQPAIMNFVAKLAAEVEAGRVEQAIALTHNYTDTAWFHLAASGAAAICFTRGRVGFLSPSGEKAAPTQGQAFFYFGEGVVAFAAEFRRFGLIVVPS